MLTYFLIAMMMAGLPPFSGFLGKVFILQATVETAYQGWIIGIVLLVSLLSIIALHVSALFYSGVHHHQKKTRSILLILFIVLYLKKHRHVTIQSSISCLPV
jgi:formate hydrogenlyase subunit 3/multisubunit Na+/H+ antiporter MnhD subunit